MAATNFNERLYGYFEIVCSQNRQRLLRFSYEKYKLLFKTVVFIYPIAAVGGCRYIFALKKKKIKLSIHLPSIFIILLFLSNNHLQQNHLTNNKKKKTYPNMSQSTPWNILINTSRSQVMPVLGWFDSRTTT